MEMLGLEKAHRPQVHKIILSVTATLKVVQHWVRIRPGGRHKDFPPGRTCSACLRSTRDLVVSANGIWALCTKKQLSPDARAVSDEKVQIVCI